jgi:hypothetical protein
MWVFIGLVVIGDFYVVGVAPVPTETDAVFIVNSYAMLAEAVTLQGFEVIARWNSEFVEVRYGFKLGQFP